ARIRRPLIAGLAAIVVVASFAALFSAGPGRSLFAHGPAKTETATIDAGSTQTAITANETATASAVKFPYVAAAPGPGCDPGGAHWQAYYKDQPASAISCPTNPIRTHLAGFACSTSGNPNPCYEAGFSLKGGFDFHVP